MKRKHISKIKLPDKLEVEKDDIFGFIVGYTSNGVPYGFTHEEYDKLEQNDLNIEIRYDD